jgi:tetratricopeptide (TPR) repeat protein
MDGRLVRAMLAAGLDPETVADVLWLLVASGASVTGPTHSLGTPPSPAQSGTQPIRPDRSPNAGQAAEAEPAPSASAGDARLPTPLRLSAGPSPGEEARSSGTLVALPDVAYLDDVADLVRPLRPFRRVRTTGGRTLVDIEATVAATADSRRLDPTSLVVRTRRETRQALDAVLVADDAPSMLPWRDTAAQVRRRLEQVGAFRAVSHWELPEATRDARRAVLRDAARTVQPASRIIDPSGNRVVLILTDAVDAGWHGQARWDAVASWARVMPTVLIQVLPRDRYLPVTGIGDLPAVVRGQRPAGPNPTLQVERMWWARPAPAGGSRAAVAVPVVALTSAQLSAWADALLTGTRWVDATFTWPPAQDLPAETTPWSTADRVVAFDARASEGARRLARILAGAPVLTLPLIRVIQASLAPETTIGDLSEIFVSGLLEEENHPIPGIHDEERREDRHEHRVPSERWRLRFRPGVAEVLRRGSSVLDEWDLHAVVSDYLEEATRGRHTAVGTHGGLVAVTAAVEGGAAFAPNEAPFAELRGHLEQRLGLSPDTDDDTPDDLWLPAPRRWERPTTPILDPADNRTSPFGRAPDDEAEGLSAELADLLQRVTDAYQERFPDALVIRAASPDGLRYLDITATVDAERRRWAVGVCLGDLDGAELERFLDQVHRPRERNDPLIESDLVYDGVLASDEFRRRARRSGVEVQSVLAVERGWDPAQYRTRQATRLASDREYPPDLYVPQRFVPIGGSPTTAPGGDVFGAIIDWLGADQARLVLVLADFGHGKTFLARELARRVADLLPRLTPMLIDLRGFEKSHSLDTVLAFHLAQAGEDAVSVSAVRRMLDRGQLLLIFDGFDELAVRLTYEGAVEHLHMILAAVSGRAKVVMTGRTQHFASDQHLLTALGHRVELLPAARVVRLTGFDDDQILEFLTRRFAQSSEPATVAAAAEAARQRLEQLSDVNLRGLAGTPRMLAFIADLDHADLLAVQNNDGTVTASDLYQVLVDRWLHFEESRRRPTRGTLPALTAAQLRTAVTAIALWLWTSNADGLGLNQLATVINDVLSELGPTPLDPSQMLFAVGSGSLLVRGEQDRFTFVDGSVQEYLVAAAAARQITDFGDTTLAATREMSAQLVEFLVGAAGRPALETWVRDLLTGGDPASRASAGPRAEHNRVARMNALAVAARLGVALNALDLSGQDLRGVDLTGLNLRYANLCGVNLAGVRLADADFTGADLRDADLTDAYLLRPRLADLQLAGSRWQRATLVSPELDSATRTASELDTAVITATGLDDGLTAAEVDALATIFGDSPSARQLLQQAGFPPGRIPAEQSPARFWSAVSLALRDGAAEGGRARLLAEARELYPGNPVFAAADSQGVAPGGAAPSRPAAWNVPARLPRFVGREALLAEIAEKLESGPQVALVALDGMGGVGKTALAVEYAHRHADDFDVVWWVPAERPEMVEQYLAALAGPLGLPEGSSADEVWAALRRVRSWLVIFDNAEDVDVLARFRPAGRGGRVLVTSRRRAARLLGIPISVPPFDRAASVELLRIRVPGIEVDAAADLAALVGDLPLAVDQVAGYLDETETPPASYAQLLMTRPGLAVTDVWQLSIDRVGAENPAAVELLELLAFCAAEPVPLDLFTAHGDLLGVGPLATVATDLHAWTDAVGALVGYSLARRDQDTLTVHRLLAAVLRQAMPSDQAAARLAVLAALLRAVLPGDIEGNPAGWQTWRTYLSHALTVADQTRTQPDPGFTDGRWLTDRSAAYLRHHGQLVAAIALFEQNLADRQSVLGRDHMETMTSLNNLAHAYWAAGRAGEASVLFQQTLDDRQRVLGRDHPDSLTSRNDLAEVYESAGQVGDAITLFEHTLTDRQRILGPDHPQTLSSRNNLAHAYETAGRMADAVVLFEQTLADGERVLGVAHPLLSEIRRNLIAARAARGDRLDRPASDPARPHETRS